MLILPPKKESKTRLKRTEKSTEPHSADTLLDSSHSFTRMNYFLILKQCRTTLVPAFMRMLCFFPFVCFGTYVGNVASPAIMNTGFFSANYLLKGTSGYIYDYALQKNFVRQKESSCPEPTTVKGFNLYSQLASFSLIFLERLELFGSVGASKENVKKFSLPSFTFEFDNNYHFSWNIGSKIVLLQWGNVFLGCDFVYFAVPSSTKSFFEWLDQFHLPIPSNFLKQTFCLHEWQCSAGLAARLLGLTPYLGGTYLHSRLTITPASDTDTELVTYANPSRWGSFIGCTLSLSGRFHINFEKRFNNEQSYTFSTTAIF